MQLSPLQKLSITVGAVLVLLGVVGGMSFLFASRLIAADRAVERVNENLSSAFRVVMERQEGERAAKAYVVRPDSVSRAALQRAQAEVEVALDIISRGTEDNPRQRDLLRQLASGAAASFEAFRTTVLIRDRQGPDSARRFLGSDLSASVSDSLMTLVARMRADELRVLAEQTRQRTAHGANAQRLILVGMMLAFVLAGLALQPLRQAVATRMTTHIAREEITGAVVIATAARSHAAVTAGRLLAVHRVVVAVADARDAAAGARAITESAVSNFRAALTAVIAPDGAGGFTVLAASDAAFAEVSPGLAGVVARTLRTGEATMAESGEARGTRWGSAGAFDTLDACGAPGAVLFAPMTWAATTVGVLVIAHATDHLFDDDELTFAATLGRLGGPVVASRSLAS